MLSLLAILIVAPVQDRAISVAEFIKSFNTESIKHVASKEMGKHIVFVHAPDQATDKIKTALAEAIEATWTKTDAGYRLERTQKQATELNRKEVAARAALFKKSKVSLREKLSANPTPEKRADAALRNLVEEQERFRTTRPSTFEQKTALPADWLLSALLLDIDENYAASLDREYGVQLSNKPVGGQKPLPTDAQKYIAAYTRDRQELADNADNIIGAVGQGPLTGWIKNKLDELRQGGGLDRVILELGRSSLSIGASIFIYDVDGNMVDYARLSIPSNEIIERLDVPASLSAPLNEVQRAFVDSIYGYSFIRNPKPEAIDKILGIEPLCSVEPLFQEVAKYRSKPTIAVLDDCLLDISRDSGGPVKNVARFVREAEDFGCLKIVKDGEWLILSAASLLDSESRRFDRGAIKPFLLSTKDAGYVTLEGHASIVAATPSNCVPLPDALFSYLDRNGYVLVSERDQPWGPIARFFRDTVRLRGGMPRTTLEVPVSSLPSATRSELLRWVYGGVGALEMRPSRTGTAIDTNGHYALPNGLGADSLVRIIPISSACIGLKSPFPAAYSAEEIGRLAAGFNKTPKDFITAPIWYGERRAMRLEILLNSKTMIANRYYESASEMKEVQNYESLPEDFRKQVEKSYEEMLRTNGGS